MEWAQKSCKYSSSVDRSASAGLNQLRSYCYLLSGSMLARSFERMVKTKPCITGFVCRGCRNQSLALALPGQVKIQAELLCQFEFSTYISHGCQRIMTLERGPPPTLTYWILVVAETIVLSGAV